MSTWIVNAARRQAGFQAVAAAVVLAALATWLVAQAEYVREYLRGAHAVSAEDVIGAAPASRGWIRLQADKLHPTGMQIITVRKKHGVERSRSVSSEFFVAELGERLLLVRGVPGQGALLEGTLVAPDGEAMSSLLAGTSHRDELQRRLLPQMIDTHDYGSAGGFWLPVGGLVALAALAWGALGLLRWHQPARHPAVRRFGGDAALQAASAAIERDLAEAQTVVMGATTITRGHVVTRALARLDIRPTTELLWAFKQVTQKKMLYVIPTGKTYAAVLNFEKGTLVLGGKEERVDRALAFLVQHAPWAVYGHTDAIAAIYKDKKQRAQLVDHVRQRREGLRA